ncbi:MAG: trigger factor [Chloroflexi bacterium RBG_13_50_10]|nr:MAG: trigger factor [Chloroflexi bacterium RBG_13_50_10]
MKVSTEPVENSQVAVNIEMEPVEVNKYLDKAYNRLVKRVSVPGFRKGKVPRDVFERHIGKDTLFQEALEDLIPAAYKDALDEQKIDPIAQPKFELIQTEPLIFKAVVPLKPTIKLGDYKQIKGESKPVEMNEEDIEATIGQLREQQAMLSPVDRTVQFGDIVTIDVEGETDGKSFPIRKDIVYEVTRESHLPLPGFAEKLEGMSKGEEKSFVLSYPSDYEMKELAGKDHAFKVKATEIKEKSLPEVDDEFAKSLGKDDLASLREQIGSNLKARAEDRARTELEQKAVDAAVEISEVEYPPVLAEREIDRLLNEEARHFAEGITGLENYLKTLNKTLDEHREELRPMASKRIVRSLVLGKISDTEKIEVDDSEIDAEVEKMVKDADKQAEEMRKFCSFPQARESIKQFLIGRKTVDRLVQIATEQKQATKSRKGKAK